MTTVDLTATVTLILALSVASERLVEIVKGAVPWLDKEWEKHESFRRVLLHVLAVIAGVVTAALSAPYLPQTLTGPASGGVSLLGLGLLASGGSGFWNSVLAYMSSLKNLKKAEAANAATK
jgi:hypothetical protein